MPARRISLLAAFLLVAASTSSAAAQSANITLTSSQTPKDNFLWSGNPGGTYGIAGAEVVSGASTAKGEYDSVIQFDTQVAFDFFNNQFGANNWDLLDIRLAFTAQPPMNVIFNNPSVAGIVNVSYMVNDGWTEGTGTPATPAANGINYNTLPTFTAGEHLLLSQNVTTGQTLDGAVNQFILPLYLPLVSEVKAHTPVSFHLAPGDPNVSVLYNSSEFTGSADFQARRPTLILSAQASAIPEPSSMTLAGLASAAMYGYRRRRLRGKVTPS